MTINQIFKNIKNWICCFYTKYFTSKKTQCCMPKTDTSNGIKIHSCKVRSIKVKENNTPT